MPVLGIVARVVLAAFGWKTFFFGQQRGIRPLLFAERRIIIRPFTVREQRACVADIAFAITLAGKLLGCNARPLAHRNRPQTRPAGNFYRHRLNQRIYQVYYESRAIKRLCCCLLLRKTNHYPSGLQHKVVALRVAAVLKIMARNKIAQIIRLVQLYVDTQVHPG